MSTPTPEEWRTLACQEGLRDADADAAVLVPGPNLRYLTGVDETAHERLFVCVVPAASDPVFVVPALSGTSVREATWVDEVRTYEDGDDPTALLGSVLTDVVDSTAEAHVLVDDSMPAWLTLAVQSAVDVDVGLASDVLATQRSRKDEAELAALDRAAAVADEVMAGLVDDSEAFLGRSESALADEIERRLDDAGGEGLPFEPIVAAGPNGAKPHHAHGERLIEAGEPVVLDFGTRVDGYPSDTTRTVVLSGEPDELVREVHAVVARAQAAAVERVEPGVEARAVDAAARAVVEAAGYGDAFIHRTGHGVGLDIHEEPYIASDVTTELEPGMVFSVEPGIYLEGRFGVRIEDLVVVTEDGCRRLNETPRGWDGRLI